MTNDVELDDKKTDDPGVGAEAPTTSASAPLPEDDAPATDASAAGKGRRWTPILAVVAAVGVIAAIVFGVLWQSASSELSDNARADDLRSQALSTATGYTERSLTYDYRDLDAFFAGVEDGTVDALRDRFESVREPLSSIMTQSQVVATGKVQGAAIESVDGNDYKVTVYATQQTQNLQQPDPGDVPNLLTVTVRNEGGQWLVADYGPKA